MLKRGIIRLLISAVLLSSGSAWLAAPAFARSYLGGTMFTRDGTRIDALRFLTPMRVDDVITGVSKGETTKIPLAEIQTLNLLTDNVNYIFQHSKTIKQTGVVSVTLRNGEVLLLNDAFFDRGDLGYVELAADRKQVEHEIKIRDLIQIRFDESVGQTRLCPFEGIALPDEYVFCPYHGVPLIWGEPDAQR